ncbi:MAG: TetR/AcrR family transcriptional regulator [Hyphomonadaceae bacterium]|nr:TetR/AcrR family transcriptional regulator [Hyphomonadaceae bacterium]
MSEEPAEGVRRRERQKAMTRNRVLAVARTLFTEHGYEAVTIRMIADEAGIAVGSVFTTFQSKSDVLSSIVVEEIDRQCDGMDEALAGVRGCRPRLRELFAVIYRFHDRHLALLLQAQSHSWVRSREAEVAVRRALIPTFKRIERILMDGEDAGEIAPGRDLRLVGEMLYACYIANYRGAAFDGLSVDDLVAAMDRQIAMLVSPSHP